MKKGTIWVLAALGAAIVVLVLVVDVMLGRVFSGDASPSEASSTPTAESTPSPTATVPSDREPTSSADDVQEDVDAMIDLSREFTASYFSHVPGLTWDDVTERIEPLVTEQFLAQPRPDDWLPVDELGLNRELRYDVEAVLDSFAGEESPNFQLGITTYTQDDTLEDYVSSNLRVELSMTRDPEGVWRVSDLTYIE